ncbi:MAG: response regulator [Desulfobacterales bacterium]|nr:response regulator [Desulfobacterales bacterium]
MTKRSTILIVDRNSHVREYLKRELGGEGYHIHLAQNCREMFERVSDNVQCDLIVIDPDLPDAEEKLLLRKLQDLLPRTPVVIHTLLADYLNHCNVRIKAILIEKDGNSIERLKHVIERQLDLKRHSPAHFPKVAPKAGQSGKAETC